MQGIDFFDQTLLALVAGVCSINFILFLIYLLNRIKERNDIIAKSRSAQNKADRPYWVVGCLISGCLWMIGTMLLSGNYGIFSEDDLYLCIFLKYLVQYNFGYILWINLIIYRLIRLYMVHAWIVKPLHAIIVLSILMAPFLLFSGLAFGLNSNCVPVSGYNGFPYCRQSLEWNIAFYVISFLYLFVFVFFAFKVRQVTGTLKDLKRYITFCGVSFVFVVFDASMAFSDSGFYPIIRQLLCFFVILIVMLQSWSIFWSVLIRKKVKKPKDVASDSDSSIMVLDERRVKIGAPELTDEELMGGPIRRSSSVDPSQYNSDHYSVRQGVVIKVRPRESVTEIMVPDTSSFMGVLTEEDLSHLNGVDKPRNDLIEVDPNEVKAVLDILQDKNTDSENN